MTSQIKATDIIAPKFYNIHKRIKDPTDPLLHIYLKGGRGSTKSSFVGAEIPIGIVRDATKNIHSNAVVIHRFDNKIESTVYSQLIKCIDMLGWSEHFKYLVKPYRIIYKPTGQEIRCVGLDDPEKLKSVVFKKGFVGYIWFEELTSFRGMHDIRNVLQSLVRGTGTYRPRVFYSWNPPRDKLHWVNKHIDSLSEAEDTIVSHTTYLDVNPSWLGNLFISEARRLEQQNPEAYRNEYLGEAVGLGADVFKNVTLIEIDARLIQQLFKSCLICIGLDLGYNPDPCALSFSLYDAHNKDLYIITELYQRGLSSQQLYEKLANFMGTSNATIFSDTNEPRLFNYLRDKGINISKTQKKAVTVADGVQWLAELNNIYIDKRRTPNAFREFSSFRRLIDKDGNIIAGKFVGDDHFIDATRYGNQPNMIASNISFE